MIRQIKYIAGIMAVGAFLASCSENDAPTPYDNPTKYISFGVPAINYEATVGDFAEGPKSRAVLTESVDKFFVWGFCVPRGIGNEINQNSASKPWVEKSCFFTAGADLANLNKREVTLNGISTTYNGGQLTEWNEDDEALSSFIAVSGDVDCSMAVANNSTDSKLRHGPKLTVTLKTDGSSLTTPLDYNAQSDALVAATFDRESRDGLVNMSFFHIMTGIRFKFNNFTEEKLVINEVTYAGKFFKEAVFDLTDDTPVMTVTDKTYSGKFTLLGEPQTIDGESSDYVQTSAYMGGDESPVTLLLLPNPAGTTADDNEYTLGTDKEITIKYTVGNGPERTFQLQKLLLNYKPLPNTLHTANFNFVGDKFVVMFQADDKRNWENGSDNKVIIK